MGSVDEGEVGVLEGRFFSEPYRFFRVYGRAPIQRENATCGGQGVEMFYLLSLGPLVLKLTLSSSILTLERY